MNYYHPHLFSFNFWYLVAPLLVVLVFYFGTTKYRLSGSRRHIRKRQDGDLLLKIVVVVADMLLHVMILIESGAGSMQVAANILGNASDIGWLPVLMAAGYTCTFVVYGWILYLAGKKGERTKKARLLKKLGLRSGRSKRKTGRGHRLEAFLNDITLL
ncbi:hypothetical protein IKF23_03000 [Candidatus Saccharibacteria bacterium]|nr:hypothetical protein [Candidatus Saccharibacteria bacterium]